MIFSISYIISILSDIGYPYIIVCIIYLYTICIYFEINILNFFNTLCIIFTIPIYNTIIIIIIIIIRVQSHRREFVQIHEFGEFVKNKKS